MIVLLFVAEQAVFAGVRIESADGEPRPCDSEPAHHAVGQPALGDDRRRREIGEHAAQRLMQRDVRDAQADRDERDLRSPGGRVEHHGEVVDAAQLGQQLGVAGVVMAGRVERRFAERGRDDAVDFFLEREFGGESHGLIGGLAGAGVDAAGRHVEHVVVPDLKQGIVRASAGRCSRFDGEVDLDDRSRRGRAAWPLGAGSPDVRPRTAARAHGSARRSTRRRSPRGRRRPGRPS